MTNLKLFANFKLLTCALLFPTLAISIEMPMTQGLHDWTTPEGKLTVIVSTYQDIVTFRRNYNFFLTPVKSKDWIQLPLIVKLDDLEYTFSSAGQGDDLTVDGVAVQKEKMFYFVKAALQKGDTLVTWFKLTEADDQHMDDPTYSLKLVFTRTYPKKSKLKIEDILKKESALGPKTN